MKISKSGSNGRDMDRQARTEAAKVLASTAKVGAYDRLRHRGGAQAVNGPYDNTAN